MDPLLFIIRSTVAVSLQNGIGSDLKSDPGSRFLQHVIVELRNDREFDVKAIDISAFESTD